MRVDQRLAVAQTAFGLGAFQAGGGEGLFVLRADLERFLICVEPRVTQEGVGVAFRRFQNGGPALATVLATIFDFFTLFIIFRLRYGALGTIQIFRSIGKIMLCAAIMGVACMIGNHYANYTLHSTFFIQLLVFIGLIGGATLLYIGLTWIFRCPEIEEVYGIATRTEVVTAGMGAS